MLTLSSVADQRAGRTANPSEPARLLTGSSRPRDRDVTLPSGGADRLPAAPSHHQVPRDLLPRAVPSQNPPRRSRPNLLPGGVPIRLRPTIRSYRLETDSPPCARTASISAAALPTPSSPAICVDIIAARREICGSSTAVRIAAPRRSMSSLLTGSAAGPTPARCTAAAPEELVTLERADHRRSAGEQPRSRRTCPAVVDNGRDTREQPRVGRCVHDEHVPATAPGHSCLPIQLPAPPGRRPAAPPPSPSSPGARGEPRRCFRTRHRPGASRCRRSAPGGGRRNRRYRSGLGTEPGRNTGSPPNPSGSTPGSGCSSTGSAPREVGPRDRGRAHQRASRESGPRRAA